MLRKVTQAGVAFQVPAEKWGTLRNSHSNANRTYRGSIAYVVNGRGDVRIIAGQLRRSRPGRSVLS